MNIKSMSKKIKITIIVAIIVSIILFLNFKTGAFKVEDNTPKELETIFEDNDFEFQDKFLKGDVVDEGRVIKRDTYRYIKDETLLSVYTYDNFEEIKNELLVEYEMEKNSSFSIKVEDEDNYYFKRSCDSTICKYSLGFENKLISTVVSAELSDSTDNIFREILDGKKLKK